MKSTLNERLSLLPKLAYEHVYRAAGKSDANDELDYSTLSVAVTTLGLILLVELIRHKLEINAVGRPFFRTVLEGVYRELATLGIVEFVIFLLHKYYKGLNIAQEVIFADVHFTLFFTALFNAFQSCIMAFFISRNSHKLWVQTEYQDLHHYVEIREEFDRIDKELSNLRQQEEQVMESVHLNATMTKRESATQSIAWISQESTGRGVGSEFRQFVESIKRLWFFLVRSVRYPRLSRKYNQLLVQVRFHELKFHFIQANNLPITIHLSDYMKRCELRILQKLVHISTFAWLLLTAALNLLYFLMGVVVFTTDGNMAAVGKTLSVLFFSAIIFFVVLSMIIWNKMTWIFHCIMYMKFISQTNVGEQQDSEQASSRTLDGAVHGFEQQSLFWGSSPKYITTILQFMQFGFALALSILLVFWDEIDPAPGSPGIQGGYYVLAVFVGYACFVYIMSHVVPRFTLCSSVGQMVDQRRLHETLARHHLELAQRARQQALMEREFEEAFLREEGERQVQQTNSLSDFVTSVITEPKLKPTNSRRQIDPALLEELVRMNTKELRTSLPEKEKEELIERQNIMQERRNRRKTLSDGVEAMREMIGLGSDTTNCSSVSDQRKSYRHNRQKSISASASIQMMRDVSSLSMQVKPEIDVLPLTTKDDSEVLHQGRAERRSNRKKTLSASGDIKMMRTASSREDVHRQSGRFDAKPSKPQSEEKMPNSLANVEIERFLGTSSTGLRTRECRSKSSMFTSDKNLPSGAMSKSMSTTTIENLKMPHEAEETRTDAYSDDDEHSDADDLPDVQEEDKLRKNMPPLPKRTIYDFARDYFRGRRYKTVSSLFGTMICFFFVGMRLEAVMIETGVMNNTGNTWNLSASVTFWIEFMFLTCFIFGDFIILSLFRHEKSVNNGDRKVCVTAIIDLCICVGCLGFLVGAQVQRCCDKSETRFLGGSTTIDDKYGYETPIECCPAFGERLYGGFGDIEMFTSLIALRVLRFWAGKRCIQIIGKRLGWPDVTIVSSELEVAVMHPLDPLYERQGQSYSHASEDLKDRTGTIVDIWESALTLHPDIVQKYGEFSGQLLQAMLGVTVIDDGSVKPVDVIKKSPIEPDKDNTVAELPGESLSSLETEREISSLMNLPGNDISQSVRADRRFASLSAASQSIILAGRLGKAVHARRELMPHTMLRSDVALGGAHDESTRCLESIHETSRPEIHRESHMSSALLRLGNSQAELTCELPLMQYPVFEIGLDNDEDSVSQFIAPSARLLRTMRRCDRKVLPMLDRWATVDVVITSFEIVYFDATDVDSAPHSRRMEDIRQAIIATKGGKGLRLRDVAFGRKVVGTQIIKDIETVNVERTLPNGNGIVEASGQEPQADEFWKDKMNHPRATEDEKASRRSRWMYVKQDRLKIKSKHDILYLRFYSDLDNCECNNERMMNENEAEGDIFKNNAFQWCQTIGRLVGTGKLKQDLPHFGDDNNEELRDYLVVVDVHKEQNTNPVVDRFKKLVVANRLQRSDAPHSTTAFDQTQPLSSEGLPSLKKGHLRRAATFGDTTTRVLDFGKITRGRRRTDSADDIIVVDAAPLHGQDQNVMPHIWENQTDTNGVLSSERKPPAKPRHVRRATSVGEVTVRVLDFVTKNQGHRRTGSARDIFSTNLDNTPHDVFESNTAPTHSIDRSVTPNYGEEQTAEANETISSDRISPSKPRHLRRATSVGEATLRALDFVKVTQAHRRTGSAREVVSTDIASAAKPSE